MCERERERGGGEKGSEKRGKIGEGERGQG